MITAYPIPTSDIRMFSSLLTPYVEKACARSNGGWSASRFFEASELGAQTVWLVLDDEEDGSVYGFAATEIQQRTDRRTLKIIMVAGDKFPKWGHLLETILVPYAKLNGCATMEFTGRVGWKRCLPSARVIKHVYEVELKNAR